MIHFAKTSTEQAITQKAQLIRYITAGSIVIMVVSQLFTYDVFVSMFRFMGDWSMLLAAFIVTLEVAALPYLLMMRLSALARFVSKMAGWLVVLLWVIVAVAMPKGDSIGLLGTVVTLSSGFIVDGLVVLLFVMMAVSMIYKGRR